MTTSNNSTNIRILHKTLTPSELANLQIGSTPIEIIPAPGNGYFVLMLQFIATVDFNTTPWTSSDANVKFLYDINQFAPAFTSYVKNELLIGLDSIGFGNLSESDQINSGDASFYNNLPIMAANLGSSPWQDGDSGLNLIITYQIIKTGL